jgi:hypothetical protein
MYNKSGKRAARALIMSKLRAYSKDSQAVIACAKYGVIRDNRVLYKRGKVLRRISRVLSELNDLANAYGAVGLERDTNIVGGLVMYKRRYITFRIHGRSEIEGLYNANFNDKSGVVGNSCMIGKKPGTLQLYRIAPVRIVIAYINGERVGRALLWHLSDGRYFLDRIYGSETVRYAYLAWAEKLGYITKYKQTYDDPLMVVRDGVLETDGSLTVTLGNLGDRNLNNLKYLPYMDTFKYIVIQAVTVFLSNYRFGRIFARATNTDGTASYYSDCYSCGRKLKQLSDVVMYEGSSFCRSCCINVNGRNIPFGVLNYSHATNQYTR